MEKNMQITISGQKLEVTQSLRDFVSEKIQKLERHSNKIQTIHMVLKVEETFRQIAEAEVVVTKEKLFASAESENMYTAIDLLIEKLNSQLIKHKEKIIDRRDDHNE